jgi:hypothetical protein
MDWSAHANGDEKGPGSGKKWLNTPSWASSDLRAPESITGYHRNSTADENPGDGRWPRKLWGGGRNFLYRIFYTEWIQEVSTFLSPVPVSC